MMQRLRTDFDLAIITLFSILGIAGISPFMIYRFVIGDTKLAIMNTSIVIAIFIGLIYAWSCNNTRRAGVVFVLISNVGCILSTIMLGVHGFLWTYPVLLVNFMMLGRRAAIVACAITLSAEAVYGNGFESRIQMIVFLITACSVSFMALIFSYLTSTQRQLLEDLSLSDSLTGAKNRRAMNVELSLAIKDSQQNNSQFGLLMIDIDHFKKINDLYGHEEGDNVLIRFSALIKKHSRKTDHFFRMGGEEFLLLLPGTDSVSLSMIAKNHCTQIANNLRSNDKVVTVSIGAAMLLPGESQQQWLARADAALYAAKNKGRNCVDIASDTPTHIVK
jgi:diguanylate cyclase